MIIQMTLPLRGTWHTREKRGDYQDSVRPFPLPFALSYQCTLQDLDIANGQGLYEIEVDDAGLSASLRADLEAFAALPVQAKRARIIAAGRATEKDMLRIAR